MSKGLQVGDRFVSTSEKYSSNSIQIGDVVRITNINIHRISLFNETKQKDAGVVWEWDWNIENPEYFKKIEHPVLVGNKYRWIGQDGSNLRNQDIVRVISVRKDGLAILMNETQKRKLDGLCIISGYRFFELLVGMPIGEEKQMENRMVVNSLHKWIAESNQEVDCGDICRITNLIDDEYANEYATMYNVTKQRMMKYQAWNTNDLDFWEPCSQSTGLKRLMETVNAGIKARDEIASRFHSEVEWYDYDKRQVSKFSLGNRNYMLRLRLKSQTFSISQHTVTIRDGKVKIGCREYDASTLKTVLNCLYHEELFETTIDGHHFKSLRTGPSEANAQITWDDAKKILDALK